MKTYLCWECPDDREFTEEEIQDHCEETGHIHTRPVIECHCGEKVLCDSFTNTCTCGTEYNRSGMRLKPRSQWEEYR